MPCHRGVRCTASEFDSLTRCPPGHFGMVKNHPWGNCLLQYRVKHRLPAPPPILTLYDLSFSLSNCVSKGWNGVA